MGNENRSSRGSQTDRTHPEGKKQERKRREELQVAHKPMVLSQTSVAKTRKHRHSRSIIVTRPVFLEVFLLLSKEPNREKRHRWDGAAVKGSFV
jgi:hypothetical protein